MPIFEYYCPDNHTVYRFFARRLGMDKIVPRCPANPKFRLEKRMSAFAIMGATDKAKKEKPNGAEEGGGDALDDPGMEKMMLEMEHEMAGLDEENPDPRQLGRMMRRMKEAMGEKADDPRMDEVIRRLESGDDPDKMEEEYGDFLDETPEGGADAGEEATTERRKLLSRWRKARRAAGPRIDPELYELDEWVGRKAGRRQERE
ncbi:MAG: cytochrome C [Verrucomicrobiales bacterium]|nr:cytochrome C [Verrucomicrobiales bacterium]